MSGGELSPDRTLVLLPELFPSGYDPELAAKEYAEERDGYTFSRISALARKKRIYISFGYPEKGGQGRVYNSQLLVGPDGSELANYRKIHLTKPEEELYTPGDSIVVADTEIGLIGLMICWDLAFPELARSLTLNGAEIILAPVAWDEPYEHHFRDFSRVRAVENTVFLVTSNHVGSIAGVEYSGDSAIYAPNGVVVAYAEGRHGIQIRTKVDLSIVNRIRDGYYTMLADRRPELYEMQFNGKYINRE